MKSPKPTHRFFDRYLDNDLEDLCGFLIKMSEDMMHGKIDGITKDVVTTLSIKEGATTILGSHYNIFTWNHDAIKKIKYALADTIKEACEYYGIDYYSSDYMINGWFNLDLGSKYGNNPYNPNNTSGFHDHMDGKGAPVFHGYYCVNAEPSSTHYLIDREKPFENINKNNRLVVSETGHPHSIGNWDWDGYRITIAYDISPKVENYIGPNWISLNEE